MCVGVAFACTSLTGLFATFVTRRYYTRRRRLGLTTARSDEDVYHLGCETIGFRCTSDTGGDDDDDDEGEVGGHDDTDASSAITWVEMTDL